MAPDSKVNFFASDAKVNMLIVPDISSVAQCPHFWGGGGWYWYHLPMETIPFWVFLGGNDPWQRVHWDVWRLDFCVTAACDMLLCCFPDCIFALFGSFVAPEQIT